MMLQLLFTSFYVAYDVAVINTSRYGELSIEATEALLILFDGMQTENGSFFDLGNQPSYYLKLNLLHATATLIKLCMDCFDLAWYYSVGVKSRPYLILECDGYQKLIFTECGTGSGLGKLTLHMWILAGCKSVGMFLNEAACVRFISEKTGLSILHA